MSTLPGKAADGELPPPRANVGIFRTLWQLVRSRILSGLIAALPIALTFFIVHWLYVTLTAVVLTPAIEVVRRVLGSHGMSQTFWYTYLAPVLAVLLVLTLLYLLGVFVQLRLMMAVDWLLMHVPVVSTIFKAVNNVFQSIGQQLQGVPRDSSGWCWWSFQTRGCGRWRS